MANSTELAVAIFGVAPGGFESVLKSYYQNNGEVAYADWLVSLLRKVYGSQVASNSQLSSFIVGNLVGQSTTTANQQFVANYLTSELNAGMDAGTAIDNLVNLVDALTTNATWGNTAQQFSNKVYVADYYTQQLGQTSTSLSTLSGVISPVTYNSGSVDTQITALTPANSSAVDVYGSISSSLSSYYSSSIVENPYQHDLLWDSVSYGYGYGYGEFVGINKNFSDNNYYYLSTSNYYNNSVAMSFFDGNVFIYNGSSSNSGIYYTPGASTFNQISISGGTINGALVTANSAILYGSETSVANASSDGYVLITNESGGVTGQFRIENTSSPTSYTSVTNLWALNSGSMLAELNNNYYSSGSYAVINSSYQITETFSFNNSAKLTQLINNSNGTHIGLTSSGVIDFFDANFNVTGTLALQSGNSVSSISQIAVGGGDLYVIASNPNTFQEMIVKIGGTTSGSTVQSAFTITSNGTTITPTNLTYDHGSVYVNPKFNGSTILELNPGLGVTANPSGTYKLNATNFSGSLVNDTSSYAPTSTLVMNGGGVYQTHTDLNLVGQITTGSAYSMQTTSLFTHGSMGTVA